MSKVERLEYAGEISECLAGGAFRVKLSDGLEVVAVWVGNQADGEADLSLNDRVLVEMTPYDLERGRIVLRLEA